MGGWPDAVSPDLKPYQNRSKELSTLNGCVLWGARVIVPPQGRAAVLEELHETHPGCTKMKALARSYIWWPKMNKDIEDLVKKCRVCQESRASPPSAPGNGLLNHGLAFILISLDRFWNTPCHRGCLL